MEGKCLRLYLVPNTKGGVLPSGETWEDYLKFCRYKMEMTSNGEKNKKRKGDSSSSTEDEEAQLIEDEEAQLIKDWNDTATLQGYMAWVLWEHIPMPGMDEYYKSQQFSASTELEKEM